MHVCMSLGEWLFVWKLKSWHNVSLQQKIEYKEIRLELKDPEASLEGKRKRFLHPFYATDSAGNVNIFFIVQS